MIQIVGEQRFDTDVYKRQASEMISCFFSGMTMSSIPTDAPERAAYAKPTAFIEKAVDFYLDYLSANDAGLFLPTSPVRYPFPSR